MKPSGTAGASVLLGVQVHHVGLVVVSGNLGYAATEIFIMVMIGSIVYNDGVNAHARCVSPLGAPSFSAGLYPFGGLPLERVDQLLA